MDAPLMIGLVAAALAVAGAAAICVGRSRSRSRLAAENTRDDAMPGAPSAQVSESHNLAPIREALASLLARSNDDAFVIFEQAGKRKFVQFAGGPGGLLLDLPVEALSESERARAESFFGAIDVRLMDQPNYSSFQVDFGRDAESAARTTLDIFHRVYGLSPDFRLTVEEN